MSPFEFDKTLKSDIDRWVWC